LNEKRRGTYRADEVLRDSLEKSGRRAANYQPRVRAFKPGPLTNHIDENQTPNKFFSSEKGHAVDFRDTL